MKERNVGQNVNGPLTMRDMLSDRQMESEFNDVKQARYYRQMYGHRAEKDYMIDYYTKQIVQQVKNHHSIDELAQMMQQANPTSKLPTLEEWMSIIVKAEQSYGHFKILKCELGWSSDNPLLIKQNYKKCKSFVQSIMKNEVTRRIQEKLDTEKEHWKMEGSNTIHQDIDQETKEVIFREVIISFMKMIDAALLNIERKFLVQQAFQTTKNDTILYHFRHEHHLTAKDIIEIFCENINREDEKRDDAIPLLPAKDKLPINFLRHPTYFSEDYPVPTGQYRDLLIYLHLVMTMAFYGYQENNKSSSTTPKLVHQKRKRKLRKRKKAVKREKKPFLHFLAARYFYAPHDYGISRPFFGPEDYDKTMIDQIPETQLLTTTIRDRMMDLLQDIIPYEAMKVDFLFYLCLLELNTQEEWGRGTLWYDVVSVPQLKGLSGNTRWSLHTDYKCRNMSAILKAFKTLLLTARQGLPNTFIKNFGEAIQEHVLPKCRFFLESKEGKRPHRLRKDDVIHKTFVKQRMNFIEDFDLWLDALMENTTTTSPSPWHFEQPIWPFSQTYSIQDEFI